MKRLSLLLLFAAPVALLLSACGSASTDAFRVNDTVVSRATFESELKEFAANEAFIAALSSASSPQAVKGTAPNTMDAGFVRATLKIDLRFALMKQEILARHITIHPSTLATAKSKAATIFGGAAAWNGFSQDFRDREANNLAAFIQLHLDIVGLTKLEDSDLKAAYDKDPTVFGRRCISHILVKTQDEATQIETQLAAGSDFATIAKAKSIDTGSGANGGDLTSGTCISKADIDNTYVGPFAVAVEAAKLGVPTAPVQSQYGWHIILITKNEPPPAWDTIKDEISSTILSAGNAKFGEWETGAFAKAKLQIDPRYGVWDAANTQVIAGPANKADLALK